MLCPVPLGRGAARVFDSMNKPTTRRAFLQALGAAAVAGAAAHGQEPSQPLLPKPSPLHPGAPPAQGPRLDAYGDPLPEGVRARMGSGRLRHGRMLDCFA